MSQYDGGNIDKEQLAKVPSKTKDAKLMIMRGDFIWSKQQDADPMTHYIRMNEWLTTIFKWKLN